MIRSARLKAYAKLNLGLRVLYKRPDSYHEIRTVFQTISLADRILRSSFATARDTSIEIRGHARNSRQPGGTGGRTGPGESWRSIASVLFRLNKRIPAGAGLGGGSSDAAAVLLALPVLAGKARRARDLHAMASELGSDVPFFLQAARRSDSGRGEELYPLPDRPATRALLVAPAIHSSTAEAYRDVSAGLTTIALQNKLFSFQQDVWERGPDRESLLQRL